MTINIDISFDFRTDTPPGQDLDTYSPTLAGYHTALWSKSLPNGTIFHLEAGSPPFYLHHHSEVGEFWLSSDQGVNTYTHQMAMQPIIAQLPDAELESFRTIAATIGAMMVWPANRIDGKPTINGARGLHRSISDRLDLTVECVRRFYCGEDNNPLRSTFERYADFFALFGDFAGFVDFFVLQDLTTRDGSDVRFFLPFDGFQSAARPREVETYVEYRRRAIEFIMARAQRIAGLNR